MLEITNLEVAVEGNTILNGFSLCVRKGEVHALMGPNGAGKSTLAKVLAGHPAYEVVSGSITFEGKDILELEADERARLGIFMGFQYPVEVPGVSNSDFLKAAYRSIHGKELQNVPEEFSSRDLNVGFSGGEKKRNEIVQMRILEPKLSILDETDSGLDIDAMSVVSSGINDYMNSDRSIILITHYKRLLEFVAPTHVHIVIDGKIARSGGIELVDALEERGYKEHAK